MSNLAKNLGLGRCVFEFSEPLVVADGFFKRLDITLDAMPTDSSFLFVIQNPPTDTGGTDTNLNFYLESGFDEANAKARLAAGKGLVLAPCKEATPVMASRACKERHVILDLQGRAAGVAAAVTPHVMVFEIIESGE